VRTLRLLMPDFVTTVTPTHGIFFMPRNTLQWLTLVAMLLLSSSGIFAERADPVSNASGSPTDRLPSPNRAAAVTLWNDRALELCVKYRRNPLRVARALAVLHVAMADAAVASWRAKFTHWTQRPVTAIRERFDPAWLPLILTPPFPSYVSTHATLSGAAAEVLAAFFPAAVEPLQAAAAEAAMSRLYGGIHFRSDNDAGLELGRRIGRLIVERK